PVDQEQVHVVEPERLECVLERAARVVRLVERVVQLARDVHLVAFEAGPADRLADPALVAVHLGGVYVAVARLQGAGDRLEGLRGIDLEDAEAELREAVAAIQVYERDGGHWRARTRDIS